MSSFKPYSESISHSGNQQLNRIPEHWSVARIKRVAELRKERASEIPSDHVYIGLEDVKSISGEYRPTEGNSRQSDDSTIGVFCQNDVLYGKLRPYLRKALVADRDGVCSTEFLVLIAGDVTPHWLQLWLLTSEVTQQISAGCAGAKMPRADWEHVGSIKIAYPEYKEQEKILSTLRAEMTRIDTLLAKKHRFIELLKEKKQTFITDVATQGLGNRQDLVNCGVEWIGSVPKHWQIKPLKYLLARPLAYGANESAQFDDPSLPRYIRITDLTDDGCLKADTFKSLPWDQADGYILSHGDVLLARSGATVGKSYLYKDTDGVACFAGYLIQARCNTEMMLPEYLYAYLQSHCYWEYIRGSNIQSTIQNVSADKYNNMTMPVPPKQEQLDIIRAIDSHSERINSLISRVGKSINLLHERRSALIAAALTGQIDLRGKE